MQLEISPRNAKVYLLLGNLYETQKDWVKAEAAFSKGIEVDPSLTVLFSKLAGVYATDNKYDKGLRSLRKLSSLNPKTPTCI